MKRFLRTALKSVRFLFLILLPHAITMEQEYCMREDNMNVAIPFRLLYEDVCPLIKDYILSEATYDFQIHCAMDCLQDPFCAGYNFKKKHQKKTPNCQLTHTLDHNFYDCNADDKGWIFYHPVAPRKVPCHKMKNCKNGGKTIIYLKDGPGSDPYKCECPKGFSGDLCQFGRLGSSKNIPGKSCKDIKQHTNTTISKEYWIKPIPTATPFLVYCLMELHEGGWTLVYRYTFTNYANFYFSNNSVTPRPNWPAPEANVDISTLPPCKDTFGAIQFNLWQYIGHEFFIRSNINDWYICKPNVGSLVGKTNGSISCQHVQNIVGNCADTIVPDQIMWEDSGPVLKGCRSIYRFDGSTTRWFPTHNSCKASTKNHKKGVPDPYGQIFIK